MFKNIELGLNCKHVVSKNRKFILLYLYEYISSAHIILEAINEKHYSVDNIFKMPLHLS